jgi:hypothetical protein
MKYKINKHNLPDKGKTTVVMIKEQYDKITLFIKGNHLTNLNQDNTKRFQR